MAVAEENILRFLLEKPAACERIRAKVDAVFLPMNGAAVFIKLY